MSTVLGDAILLGTVSTENNGVTANVVGAFTLELPNDARNKHLLVYSLVGSTQLYDFVFVLIVTMSVNLVLSSEYANTIPLVFWDPAYFILTVLPGVIGCGKSS